MLLPMAAQADRDTLVEGARMCTQYFPVEERKNTIPTHLLAAIATTESGRWHKGLGMAVPWPWTINVEGKGYYFSSKAEAIAQVKNLMAQGSRSIDVGCMQVNLKHHPKAFANLDEAFDPATNVAYAAKFLHDNYADLGDWIKATAAYHSRTPIYGNRYLGEIEKSWNRIVSKVATARASQGAGPASEGTAQLATFTPAAAPAKTFRPIRDTHNVKVIRVAERAANSPRNDVLVIRPSAPVAEAPSVPKAPTAPTIAVAAPSPASVKLADASPLIEVTRPVNNIPATPAATAPLLPAGDTVRRVSLGAPAEAKQTGPKFVFAN
ncbi:MAG: transglycosylase SLT domain-containing protein [Rickettsiales bacterium]